ncbi:polysaccharide deacetylase family protein [Pyrofollis japonicus]|uniref:polysaccharide deacetylase family protein n=1 Tax=Pyrofollis japonicus TaxID=3060460 RepID=UPI00295B8227|nr:polysaccharide deacetylase family protein [Pyrofollis japonicus]BEP17670.1 polysaccharide deacetylase family protein [Pyrofollis japonicus]
MEKIVLISFDVEPDCPPYLSSTTGIEQGMPLILELLSTENVRATFFTTAVIAEKFPKIVKRIVDEGHELGCHGYRHERFDKLSYDEARKAIEKATTLLRRFGDVISFRAPNLMFPEHYIRILIDNNYMSDSSNAKYKPPFPRGLEIFEEGIIRVPASVTSSVLRLPWRIQKAIHSRLKSPIVYFAHPWEYVDMRKKKVRFDCKFGTGEHALKNLQRLIQFHREKGAVFMTFREFVKLVFSSRIQFASQMLSNNTHNFFVKSQSNTLQDFHGNL